MRVGRANGMVEICAHGVVNDLVPVCEKELGLGMTLGLEMDREGS